MEKINIAELLKDCPEGMELDCTIFEDVTLYKIDTDIESDFPIRIKTKNDYFLDLTKYGTYSNVEEAKCVIFPKGKTTWEGFHRPFIKGDIVSTESGMYIGIVKSTEDSHNCYTFCTINDNEDFFINNNFFFSRLATEEEKQKLFQAIKENGYKWNEETKTLEKLIEPKFKVGDRIKLNNSTFICTITDLLKDRYRATVDSYGLHEIEFERQDAYLLVPNKFDINNLVPFESRILVRDNKDDIWQPAIYGCINKLNNYVYTMNNSLFYHCIPYEGNEHLLGTTNDCDDFYKTWEK